MAEIGYLLKGISSRKHARGQAIPLDFMAGLFIFLVLLAYFIVLWDIFSVRYIEHAESNNIESRAIDIAGQLVSSSGQPFNWTSSPLSAQSIGLASKPYQLDPNRISAFASLSNQSYANAKLLLGTDRDFFIKIETPDGARIATLGKEPGNASRSVEVSRLGSYNGQPTFVRVRLYE